MMRARREADLRIVKKAAARVQPRATGRRPSRHHSLHEPA